MEPHTRKRKLNEIDTNLPIHPTSIPCSDIALKNTRKLICKKTVQPIRITPSNGCENVKSRESDVNRLESPRRQSVLRCHMRTCDRSYRKSHLWYPSKNDGKLCVSTGATSQTSKSAGSICPSSGFVSDGDSTLKIPDFPPGYQPDRSRSRRDERTFEFIGLKDFRILFSEDYFEEIATYELGRDKNFKLSRDYCKKFDIDPLRREILIDWLINIQVHFKACNPTLYLAISLLDNVLDRIYVPVDQLQASAVAAFWVAYKFMEGHLSVKKLISLCAGSQCREVILSHEKLVLKSSDFLQIGGSESNLYFYIAYSIFGTDITPEIYYSGQFFLELMLINFGFIDSPAREKAAAAACITAIVFNGRKYLNKFNFARFIAPRKLDIMCLNLTSQLQAMFRDEEFMRSSSLFRKYRSPRYLRITSNKALRAYIG